MLQARDRYSGGRIVAAIAMSLAGLGAVNVHFQAAPPDSDFPVGLLYFCGGAAGLLAGWKHLGRHLGRGFFVSITWGLTAAGLGLLYALLAVAVKNTIGVYGFSKFDTVMELVNHLISKAMEFMWAVLEPRQVAAIVLGAVLSAVFAEHYQRMWR